MAKKTAPKILIIDDDLLLNRMYQLILKEAGCEVINALNGEEGLAKAIATKPDLILLDIIIPKKDGLAVLKDLKSTKDLKEVPVICLTVLDDEKTAEKCLAAGAVDYFVKAETTPDQVISKIAARLNHFGNSF